MPFRAERLEVEGTESPIQFAPQRGEAIEANSVRPQPEAVGAFDQLEPVTRPHSKRIEYPRGECDLTFRCDLDDHGVFQFKKLLR